MMPQRVPLPPTKSLYPAQCQQATLCTTSTTGSAPQHHQIVYQQSPSYINSSPHQVVQAPDSCSIPSVPSTASLHYAPSRGTAPITVSQRRYSPMNQMTTTQNVGVIAPCSSSWSGMNGMNGIHGINAMNGINGVHPVNAMNVNMSGGCTLSPQQLQCKMPSFSGSMTMTSGISPSQTMNAFSFEESPVPPNSMLFGL